MSLYKMYLLIICMHSFRRKEKWQLLTRKILLKIPNIPTVLAWKKSIHFMTVKMCTIFNWKQVRSIVDFFMHRVNRRNVNWTITVRALRSRLLHSNDAWILIWFFHSRFLFSFCVYVGKNCIDNQSSCTTVFRVKGSTNSHN